AAHKYVSPSAAKTDLPSGLMRALLVLPNDVIPIHSREPLAKSQSCTGEFVVLTANLFPSRESFRPMISSFKSRRCFTCPSKSSRMTVRFKEPAAIFFCPHGIGGGSICAFRLVLTRWCCPVARFHR